MTTRRCLPLLLAVLLALLGSSVGVASDVANGGKDLLTPEERLWLTQNHSRLVLAVETGYAPFVFIDANDRPTGLAHDYLSLLETKLGVRFPQRRFSTLDDIF